MCDNCSFPKIFRFLFLFYLGYSFVHYTTQHLPALHYREGPGNKDELPPGLEQLEAQAGDYCSTSPGLLILQQALRTAKCTIVKCICFLFKSQHFEVIFATLGWRKIKTNQLSMFFEDQYIFTKLAHLKVSKQ